MFLVCILNVDSGFGMKVIAMKILEKIINLYLGRWISFSSNILKYIKDLFSDYNFSIRILTDNEIQYDQIIMNTSKLSNYLNFN